MADTNTPAANAAPAQSPAADAPAQSQEPAMDPNTAADVLAVAFTRAVEEGMDPAFKTFMVSVSESGDVAIQSESAGGSKFEGIVAAADVAEALGMDAAE